MTRTRIVIAAFCVALGLAASPASAQATRTWVSGVGDDVNPCSRTAPCKTFAGAISKTATGGEINVLDSGGYGAVTITKSMTINGAGAHASILAANVNGVIVNAPGGSVILRNIDINGANTTTGNGIRLLAGDLRVEDSSIQGMRGTGAQGNGIDVQPTTSFTRLFVKRTRIVNNNSGINVKQGTVGATLFIEDTVIDRNATFGLKTDGAAVLATLNNSTILSTPGLQILGGSKVNSFGNNVIVTGAPSAMLSLQ